MIKSDLIIIRDFLPNDKNFILSTFLIGLYYGKSPFSEMAKQTFMENYHKVLENLLKLSTIKIKIACLKDEPDAIVGYIIINKNALVYTFVKKPWRGIGIARDLLPKDIKVYTHYTKVGLVIAKKKGLIFNPFIY